MPFPCNSYTGNNEKPLITDKICWSLDIRYCGASLYVSSLWNSFRPYFKIVKRLAIFSFFSPFFSLFPQLFFTFSCIFFFYHHMCTLHSFGKEKYKPRFIYSNQIHVMNFGCHLRNSLPKFIHYSSSISPFLFLFVFFLGRRCYCCHVFFYLLTESFSFFISTGRYFLFFFFFLSILNSVFFFGLIKPFA